MEKYNTILQKFNGKGWDLYVREKEGGKLTPEETNNIGPIREVQENTQYGVWPRGFAFGDTTALQVVAEKHGKLDVSIEIPEKTSGSITYRFGNKGQDKYPDSLSDYQGQRINFIGLTLSEDNVELLRGAETRINLDDFIKALDSLADISKLVV